LSEKDRDWLINQLRETTEYKLDTKTGPLTEGNALHIVRNINWIQLVGEEAVT